MVASLRDIAHRGDRVYLNIDRELANIWAVPYTNNAGGGGYGWLYQMTTLLRAEKGACGGMECGTIVSCGLSLLD